jgi:hypothetical protein
VNGRKKGTAFGLLKYIAATRGPGLSGSRKYKLNWILDSINISQSDSVYTQYNQNPIA